MIFDESALAGYRVLDLAGPQGWYGTKLLADLGADVIRIEPPGGDPARGLPPFFRDRPGTDASLAFNFYNTSKRSMVIDLTTSAGKDVFRRLAATADIIIETEHYWKLAEADIGYDALTAGHPGLIWSSISPFGLDGPRAAWKGSDLVAMAAGGVLYLNGFPEDPPMRPPLEQAYHQGGIAAVTGALIALQQRHRTGKGQLVEVSLQQAVATATENTIGFWDVMRIVRERMGAMGFQGFEVLFRCKDGWVVGVHGNRWEALLKWAELAGIADEAWRDPRWLDREERDAHQDVMNAFVNQLIASQTKREVSERTQQFRIALQAVQEIPDLIDDPQLAARGYWTAVANDSLGTVMTFPGAPFQSTGGMWRIRRHAPLPGEHTREVLNEIDITGVRVDALIAAGVVQQWPDVSSPNPDRATPRSTPGERKPTARRTIARATGVTQRPLAGIRVVDFTQSVTGPLAMKLMADHGAEILKVEWGRRPDGIRHMSVPRPPGNRSPNVSATFNNFNSGKRSFNLNLNLPEAHDAIKELVAIADIVVDNFGVDPMPKWGLTYGDLRRVRPDIIVARSSVMGRSGPKSGTVGFGYGIAAVAGWNALMSLPGRPPVGMGPAYPDTTVNCHHLLIAILSALERRGRTGQGQCIDLSQYESTITWLGPAILDYTVNGRTWEPCANRHPLYSPHGVYPTRAAENDSGWIAIAVDPASWPAFQSFAATDGLRLDDAYFSTHESRKEHEDELDSRIADWTCQLDARELAERLQAAGIPAAAVNNGPMLVSDPQLAHQGYYVPIDQGEAGVRLTERHAFNLVSTPGEPSRAPLLGEYNDWVFQELLGWSEDTVSSAYVNGIIE